MMQPPKTEHSGDRGQDTAGQSQNQGDRPDIGRMAYTDRLLMDEPPLLVLPSLAASVGLNEAIVLQQLHWMLRRDNALVLNGERWLKVPISEWSKVFPFWSEATIKRIFSDLRKAGLVRTSRGREGNVYTLNYPQAPGQSDTSDGSKRSGETDQIDPAPCKREKNEEENLAATGVAAPSLPGMEAPNPEPQSDVPGIGDIALELWEHYVALFGDRMKIRTLTPPRRRSLTKGLKAAGADEDPAAALDLCKRAASGLKSWRTSHPHGSQDVAPSVIFETGPHSGKSLTDQIEWWAQQATDSATAIQHSHLSSALSGRINERRLTVVRMHQQPDDSSLKARGEQALHWLREHAKEEPIIENGEVTGWRPLA